MSLTNERINEIFNSHRSHQTFARAIEQELCKQEPEVKQEPVGQFTVSGGRSINQIIKFETYLPDGDYQIYASPQPCPKCASGILCADCLDTGWLENRVEGRYPCTCMTEMEPYQLLQAKCAELEKDRLQQGDVIVQLMRDLDHAKAKSKELEKEILLLRSIVSRG